MITDIQIIQQNETTRSEKSTVIAAEGFSLQRCIFKRVQSHVIGRELYTGEWGFHRIHDISCIAEHGIHRWGGGKGPVRRRWRLVCTTKECTYRRSFSCLKYGQQSNVRPVSCIPRWRLVQGVEVGMQVGRSRSCFQIFCSFGLG